ncbi:MAG TPA: Crp/Fnr family transcriptional regulator [Steroidobacteraceae bacterium]|nr:Crp/Fnr family transcriptional regulator [Steroidobacteraceae bacterium]
MRAAFSENLRAAKDIDAATDGVVKIEQTLSRLGLQNRRVLIRHHADIQTGSGCPPHSPQLPGNRSASLVTSGEKLKVMMSEQSIIPKTTKRPRRFDPVAFLEIAAKGRSISTHRNKEIIFTQGSPADAVFYIKKGKVKVTVVSKLGKEAVVAILGVGEFVGEGCLSGQPKRLATASAMTECVTMRVAKTEIQRVIRGEPAFSQMFMSHLLARNIRVEGDLLDQLFNSTEKRLARLLLLLANFGKEGRPEPVIAKINQETLAEMVGTTRSRVSHFMNKFRKSGFIDYNGHLEVHSSLLSVVLAEQPRSVEPPQ